MLISFPFPGIQVIWVRKCCIAFQQRVKIGERFPIFAGFSRHFFLGPRKYFFQKALLLQVGFPVIVFHKIFAPKLSFEFGGL